MTDCSRLIYLGWKCANCLTSVTPGWRAGETPEQKLCNGRLSGDGERPIAMSSKR